MFYKTRKNSTLKTFLFLSVLSLLSACNSTVDADVVEADIASYFLADTGIEVKFVACPEDVEYKDGNGFSCDLETVDGKKIKISAVVDADADQVSWEVKAGLLSSIKLEQIIKEEFDSLESISVKPDCGSTDIIAYQGDLIKCTVLNPENQKGIVQLVVTDNRGGVRLQDLSSVKWQT